VLRSRGYDVDLAITGTGPLEDTLKRLAADEGIGDHVHFVGLLDEDKLYRLVSELDAYVMPSRWEGYCVGVAEAMTLGIPCILSDIPVFHEVYGDCALYHSVGDFEGLASTIERLLSEDTDLNERLSVRGRELVQEEYQIEAVAAQYESLYKRLV
jgi:glycosyltransferase involved in cell wall biosynthesis